MRLVLLATILMAAPCWAENLAPYSGEIEYRGDWGDEEKPRPFQMNLKLRGRGEELHVENFTREIPYPTWYDSRPTKTRYRLNQTIVGRKYTTRSSGDIFGGSGSTSCHYVVTRMTLVAGVLETRDYTVIESARGRCPADRDVLARFRPIEGPRSLDFRSGQLTGVKRYQVAAGRVALAVEAAAAGRAAPAGSEVDEDRTISIEKPSSEGGATDALPAATAQ